MLACNLLYLPLSGSYMNLIELSHQVLYETLNVLFGKRARIW
jgi:hypothetical protein